MKLFQRTLIVLAVAALIVYVYMPVVNFGFIGFPVLLLALTVIWMLTDKQLVINATTIQQYPRYKIRPKKAFLILLALLFLYITVVPLVTTWALFHNQRYRNLIGTVEEGKDLSTHMAPISLEKIRVVDQNLAATLGDKVLGAQPALGSQVVLGTFSIQKVNNELYWVAPLLHSGFFKWWRNNKGTNGYVMVNATNERDVKLVQQVGGKSIRIKYQSAGYFFDNLERHLYFHGYFNKGLTDYTFEVDESGNPFWVITRYKKTIGFAGENATGIVLVNCTTGESKEYGINNAPEWVDRIQPSAFIEKQLNDWGEYVKGYWNFSNENKLQITEGLTLVYGEDNRAYWYTGLTSVGADEATVGFVLVDTRTKKAVWYKQGGATEYAAQQSAQGKVQEKGYYATLPIPYNLNNIPTYIMTLKDRGGLVKMFAMVAIEDYTIVGVGNTLRETVMAYKNAFNMSGNKINTKSETNKAELQSTITRINGDIKNGNSFYYFTLSGSSKIFIGSSQISNELPVTAIGDSVKVSFDNDTQEVIDVSTFDNLSLQ
jgi:hypothetical protein